MPRTLSANSRLYIELGSVWVKILASQKAPFNVITYNPEARRVQMRVCTLKDAGTLPTKRFTTTRGTYEVGADAWVRLANGEPRAVADLQPGMQLQATMLHNNDGLISVETIYRDIWLHELVEADSQGYQLNLSPRPDLPPDRSERVIRIEDSPDAPCYTIDFGTLVPETPTRQTKENLMLWSDGASFGTGIYACC
jgi:hypothetical protein